MVILPPPTQVGVRISLPWLWDGLLGGKTATRLGGDSGESGVGGLIVLKGLHVERRGLAKD